MGRYDFEIQEIKERIPDLTLEICASGGHRLTAEWMKMGAPQKRCAQKYIYRFTRPASTIFCRLIRMPSLALYQVRPPWK